MLDLFIEDGKVYQAKDVPASFNLFLAECDPF